MPHIQVKNVPPEFHARLREVAASRGCRVKDIVLEALRKELDYLEFERCLQQHEPVELGGPAAELLAEARAERESSV